VIADFTGIQYKMKHLIGTLTTFEPVMGFNIDSGNELNCFKEGLMTKKQILRCNIVYSSTPHQENDPIEKKTPDRFCSKFGNLYEKIQLDLWRREKGESRFEILGPYKMHA
jgi:hypothetical protein